LSSPSATTIATPSPLSPTTPLSFSTLAQLDGSQRRKRHFSLPRIITGHGASSINSPSHSPGTNLVNVRASAQLDPPLLNFAQELPPLSLPPHTLSFSPESVASFFSSGEQIHAASRTALSSSPPSPSLSSVTPASFIIPSPSRDIASLPEIPPFPGFVQSFYPVDSTDETHSESIHTLFSPSGTIPSRKYNNDSPVLPSDEETSPIFTSLVSPMQRGGLSPSSAEMDAFGFAASEALDDTRSVASIPTSFRSHSVAESGSRESPSADVDDTLRQDTHKRQDSSSASFSLSLLSTETVSFSQHQSIMSDSAKLRRQQRRSDPPLLLPATYHALPLRTTTTSSAVSIRAPPPNKLSSVEKAKKFSRKVRNFFSFKTKAASKGVAGIGVTRSTQVTCVEYTSVSLEQRYSDYTH
jgi:hypothetical protein